MLVLTQGLNWDPRVALETAGFLVGDEITITFRCRIREGLTISAVDLSRVEVARYTRCLEETIHVLQHIDLANPQSSQRLRANDPARRRAAIEEIYIENGVFYDPSSGVYRGRDEIDRIAGAIRSTHPDFQYQPIAVPEESGNGGRIRWVSGRPGESPAYAGTDFIIAQDGRIAAVYLFWHKLTSIEIHEAQLALITVSAQTIALRPSSPDSVAVLTGGSY